jgi:hypothetical protein
MTHHASTIARRTLAPHQGYVAVSGVVAASSRLFLLSSVFLLVVIPSGREYCRCVAWWRAYGGWGRDGWGGAGHDGGKVIHLRSRRHLL